MTAQDLFKLPREIYRFTAEEDRALIQLEQMFSGGRALTQAEWWGRERRRRERRRHAGQ